MDALDFQDSFDAVFDFAAGERLLRPTTRLEGPWKIIHDFEEAKRLAWESTIGADELLWTDLREMRMAEVHEPSYRDPNRETVEDEWWRREKRLMPLVRRRLGEPHRDMLDDVLGDLRGVALNRVYFGATGFYETLFDAYRAGGWPCGWFGEYPGGTLAVYFPASI